MKVLHIGAGEGGSQIANLIKKMHPEAICKTINTSPNDHAKATNLKEEDKLLLENTKGFAKKMKAALEIIQSQGETIVEKLIIPELEQGVERIILHATTGGGTGIGITTALSKVFKENLGDDVKFAVSLVAPFEYDDSTAFKNTLLSIKMLEELQVPTRIISNSKFLNREGSSEADIHFKVNRYIVSTLMEILDVPNKKTIGRNTDYEEIDEVLFEPGYTFIFKSPLSNKYKDKNLSNLLPNLNQSLDLGFTPGDYIKNRLIVLSANHNLASELNLKDINEQIGEAHKKTFFTHIEPDPNQEYILFVFSGCNLPKGLEDIQENLKHFEEKESKKTSLNLDLSLFKDEEKTKEVDNQITKNFFQSKEENSDIIKPEDSKAIKISKKWKFWLMEEKKCLE